MLDGSWLIAHGSGPIMNGMIRLDNVTACNCMPDNYTAFALEKSAYLGTGSSDPTVIDVSV